MTKHFHKILKNQFKDKNLSELSRTLEIPRSVLADWLDGREPSLKNLDYLKRIADHIGISLDELLTGETQVKKMLSAVTFEDEGKRYQILINRIK